MSRQQRLGRLELVEQERWLYREAERLCGELGVSADELVRQFWEMAKLVQQRGMDGALRWLARENDLSEDEARAVYEAVVVKRKEGP